MAAVRNMAPQRLVVTRSVMLFYLLSVLWRFWSHLHPFQLQSPAIFRTHYDLTFWLYRLTGIDTSLVYNSAAGITFSVAIIAFAVLAIIFPLRRGFAMVFSLLFFTLAVVYNIYLGHSAHYLGGMVLISVGFWAKSDDNFNLMWEGIRYYACWVYTAAFLWKIVLGSFFQWDAGMLSFRSNLAEYLFQNPDTAMAGFYYFFQQHPALVNIGHKLVILAEGVFALGFFTKKYDVLLILMAIFIFLGIYLFADVFFAELLVIIFPLIPLRSWQALGAKIPLLNKGASTKQA